MTTVTFDTQEFVGKLRDAGFDEGQAETVVRVIVDAQAQVVTKVDLQLELAPVKADISLIKWMLGLLLAGVASLVLKIFF